MTWIVESIGKWGVKATNSSTRLFTPHAGDVIDFGEDERPYPFDKCRFGRIEHVGPHGFAKEGKAHICCEPGSAFLYEDGSVSISGGPFEIIKLSDLEPAVSLKAMCFWNWGNNMQGADQGIGYLIARPVFRYRLGGK